MNSAIIKIAKWAQSQQWTVEDDASGYTRFYNPQGVYIARFPATPSNEYRRMRDLLGALKKAGLTWPPPSKKERRAQHRKEGAQSADWVVTFTFDADPSMETMDAWETQLEGFDALVSRVPGHGIDVTVYAPGDWSVFDALAKMAGEVMPVVQAKSPIAVQIISEPEHRLRAEAFTTPELMSAAEIADELGVSRQRVHQLRSTAGFPAPLADLRGGAVWDAAAVRRFAETWERKPGRPHTGTAKFAYSWAVGPAVGRSGKAPNVRWRVENPDKIRFVLRNIGDDIAEDVEIDLSRIDAITRNVPKKTVIRPGEGLNMVLIAAWGHPLPNQLYVRWAGQDEWAAVPLHPAH